MKKKSHFFRGIKQDVVIPIIDWSAFSCVRSTEATYIDSSGNRQTSPVNTRRIDYLNSIPELLVESASKNLYLNSDVLVTQNVTISKSFTTISFEGTGSITLSGVASGVLNGTGVNDRVSLTVSTSSGTLTSTVSGDVRNAQCEETGTASGDTVSTIVDTSYIPTTTVPVKREEEKLSYNNIVPIISTQFTLFVDFKIQGRFNNNNYYFFRLSSSDNQDFIQFYNALGEGRIMYCINGVKTDRKFSSTQYPNVEDNWFRLKIALVGNGSAIRVFANGEESIDYTDGQPMGITGMNLSSLTELHLNSLDSPWGRFNARYKEIGFTNSAYSDNDVINLTTI